MGLAVLMGSGARRKVKQDSTQRLKKQQTNKQNKKPQRILNDFNFKSN
jgi:hypothetical protein